MKKILLSAVAVMAFGFANAQDVPTTGFSQGDVFISGAVGYTSEKTGDFKTDQFKIIPRAAYFVTNNISVGVQLGYTTGTATTVVGGPVDPITVENDVKTFEAGAFGRYYFTPARNFSFFGQLGVGYMSTKTEPEGGPDTKDTGINLGLAPGISYFVSEHIALEATFGLLGYNSVNPDGDGDNTNTFNIGTDFNDINFGIVYKF